MLTLILILNCSALFIPKGKCGFLAAVYLCQGGEITQHRKQDGTQINTQNIWCIPCPECTVMLSHMSKFPILGADAELFQSNEHQKLAKRKGKPLPHRNLQQLV